MGTRGAYGLHKGGVDKIAYNHWDSYPTGLGADVAAFVCKHTDEEMAAIFDRIELVATKEKPTSDQIAECMPFIDGDVSKQTPEDWYCLLRTAQGDLEAHAGGLRYMVGNANFLQDSLFCEWGYVINLDKGVLEIYRGFQKEPSMNRYFRPKMVDTYIKNGGDGGYYNCALIQEVPFATIREIPTYMATLEDEIGQQEGED